MKLREILVIIILAILTLAVLDVLVITHIQTTPREVDMVVPSPPDEADDDTGTTRT